MTRRRCGVCAKPSNRVRRCLVRWIWATSRISPIISSSAESDHFVVALSVEQDYAVVHDPNGFPYATLPLDTLLQAWRAERIGYITEPYTLRADFQLTESMSRQAMIAATLPYARSNLRHDPGGPAIYGGVHALRVLAQLLHADMPKQLGEHLVYFALPFAVRRKLDAAAFLREGNQPAAAELIEHQARLLGCAQYPAVQHEWPAVAALVEQVVDLEERLLALCASW